MGEEKPMQITAFLFHPSLSCWLSKYALGSPLGSASTLCSSMEAGEWCLSLWRACEGKGNIVFLAKSTNVDGKGHDRSWPVKQQLFLMTL